MYSTDTGAPPLWSTCQADSSSVDSNSARLTSPVNGSCLSAAPVSGAVPPAAVPARRPAASIRAMAPTMTPAATPPSSSGPTPAWATQEGNMS